jgi:hypothetical protein
MLRSSCGGLVGLAASLLVLSCTSPSDPRAGADSDGAPPAMTKARVAARAAKRVDAIALASDAAGLPRMMTATGAPPSPSATPEVAARHHLARLAPAWLAGGPGADTELIAVHRLTGGASIVRFRQRIGGVEIHGGEVRMLLGADGSLRAVTGRLFPATVANDSFRLDDTSAVSVALKTQFQVEVPASAFSQREKRGDYRTLALPPRTDVRVDALRTKQVYLPVDGKLTAAWFVELFGQRSSGSEQQARRYLVAAGSGKVLRNVDLKSHEAFNYRVYAETTGDKRPLDGPIADWSPHPAGTPDGSYPAYIPANLVSIDGFNEPGDPWLAADATTTVGNNVEAGTDRNGDNLVAGADIRAETTRSRTFDYAYNTAADPLATPDQGKAALVHLFYTLNWLHDWWYDSGFTEVAGNAQRNNLGRGGIENDVLIADGQDGAVENPGATAQERAASRNNANMSTPFDGMSPRMQMFLWTNPVATIELTPGGTRKAGAFDLSPANFDVSGGVTLVDDGSTTAEAPAVGTVTDGCQAISTNLTGRIALIDRGACNFTVKVKNAQDKGAIGVIIANNTGDDLASGTGEDPAITIGALGVTLAQGTALKAALGTGVNARLRQFADAELDGNLDTSVVAHEWGHYFHHRLSLCESTKQCGAMSEGWADFIALHLMARSTDDFDGGAYAVGVYDTKNNSKDAGYFAIRRYPYSNDKAKNPLTFQHLADSATLPTTAPAQAGPENSEVHAAGEVWAVMLWDAYVAVLEAHPFEDARRRMGDYVVAGLLMAPDDATFTETRDALLIATAAIDQADMNRMAEAFAGRGAGPCAVSPPPGSETFDEVVESTAFAPNLVAAEVVFEDDVASCDEDGYLDPGETGTLTITVANASALAASGVGITVTSPVPGITITPGTVGDLAPFAQQTVTLTVTAAADAPVDTDLAFAVSYTGVETCADADQVISARLGIDEQPEGSATDDIEASETLWTPSGANGELVWSRELVDTRVWNGLDAPVLTDTALVSPPLAVGKRNNLTISFRHRYQFEASPLEEGGEDIFWDGGVVEVSSDDGATWKDVTELGGEPRYGGVIAEGEDASENVLKDREAYIGTSPAAPDFDVETINLGKKLAGKAIRLRFRIGTDQNTGAYGWDVDDIKIGGLTTTPFTAVLPENGVCEGGVGVDAGPEQTVLSGAQVTLYGSTTLDGATPTWSRTAGADVSLSGGNTLTATFEAPDVDTATTVTLNLTVTAGAESLSDSVTITIAPLPEADPDGDDGGCCDTGGTRGANLLAPLALIALALWRRRRRAA